MKATHCCSFDCAQGRRCPARQACELPDPDEPRSLLASRWFWLGGWASLALWLAVIASLLWWLA